MRVTMNELKYRMRQVLLALARNENVKLYHHGKIVGAITASSKSMKHKVSHHPYFDMKRTGKTVKKVLSDMRSVQAPLV